ncbi:uncharacterized protein BJX67DRAFT_373640 [Aspergillus lucknowensis]|uniref:Rhodopsin domain-containing protein n=1 Tax=Aspergillus lucknowensis TaxID=176173 RepID=A0ABR4LJW3_9EURO
MAETQGPKVAGIAIAFAAITLVVLLLRLFARVYVLKKRGIDDYPIIFACCFSWAFSSVTVVAFEHGLGKHIEDVDPEGMVTYSLNVWLSSMFYLSCLGFVKTSVCSFYTRQISHSHALANVLTAAFQCRPIPKAWDVGIEGTCVNINVFYLANAALNILTDLLTYTLPIRVIFRLQMPRKQKIALVFIICLGLFACVSSIIRITFIPEMLTSADATWAISGAMYWSAIEINIGILAASFPSFNAIASRFLPRLLGEYSSGKHYVVRSGFSKVRDRSHDHVGMNSLQHKNHIVVGTNTHSTMDRTSEERFIVPNRKIYTHTEIEVRQDCM